MEVDFRVLEGLRGGLEQGSGSGMGSGVRLERPRDFLETELESVMRRLSRGSWVMESSWAGVLGSMCWKLEGVGVVGFEFFGTMTVFFLEGVGS